MFDSIVAGEAGWLNHVVRFVLAYSLGIEFSVCYILPLVIMLIFMYIKYYICNKCNKWNLQSYSYLCSPRILPMHQPFSRLFPDPVEMVRFAYYVGLKVSNAFSKSMRRSEFSHPHAGSRRFAGDSITRP
jgi:hypothetical protein